MLNNKAKDMNDKGEWAILWDKAKELEKEIPPLKKLYFTQIKAQFPEIKQKSFGRLKVACEKYGSRMMRLSEKNCRFRE